MIIKLHPRLSGGLLAEAVRHLADGGLLIYPTETAYALGADAYNPRAVAKIFKIKGRSKVRTLPVIVGDARQARRLAVFSEEAEKCAKKHWPGPLTLALPAKSGSRLARGALSGNHTVAVRVSSHPLARRLSRALGRPIVSTSANRSGEPAAYSIAAVKKQFGGLLRGIVVIDAGALPRRAPSAIVDMTGSKPRILRQGSIRLYLEKIER